MTNNEIKQWIKNEKDSKDYVKEAFNQYQCDKHFDSIPKEAQKLYKKAEDHYREHNDEYSLALQKIIWEFPWDMQQGINLYDEKGILQTLPKLRSAMDKHVEGFKFQKDRICKYLIDNSREKYTLSVLHLQSNHEIGKKVLMNDIADGLGRKTYFISMGPVYYVDDMIELLYGNDSHPGCILKAMLETGVNNPIIVFKDMDVLDEKCTLYFEKFIRELNWWKVSKNFIDKYVGDELKFDVSNVSFSSTSYAKVDTNVVFTVLFPDRDSTAKNKSIMEYLLPKLYNKFDIAPEELPITIEQINALSDDLYRADKTSNPDMVYYAKMILTDIMLEYKYRKSTNTLKNFKITTQLVRNLYDIPDDIPKIHSIKPGVVCGLAVNNASASVDYIECTKYKSKNDYIKFSGQGHDSSAIDAVNDAYAYIRTNAEQFKLNPENFVGNQLYFKFFGGGNSLGTLATTAILSCFKQIIVSSDICMTGVVDINGDVKAIGRVDEKIKAAIANNMKVIYVPFENKNEALKSLSKEQLNKVKVIYVKTYMEIYKDIFGDK